VIEVEARKLSGVSGEPQTYSLRVKAERSLCGEQSC